MPAKRLKDPLYIDISGTADKANKDEDGNVIKDTYVKKSGDTVTGTIKSTKNGEKGNSAFVVENNTSSSISYYNAKRTDTDTSVSFGVGSGGINHGIWSDKLNKWMIHGDVSNVYLSGISDRATADGSGNNIVNTYTTKATTNNIEAKIPAQASTSNQLADKNFVNSSVQTATANFRGNWTTWANAPTDVSQYPTDYAGSHTPTVNDYLVIQDASDYTEETLEGTWRFKYSGDWDNDGKDGWHPEYQVNETPMTAVQLAALNSGITDTAVTKLNGIAAGAEVNVQSDWDQTDNSADDFIKNKPTLGSLASKNTVQTGDIANDSITGDKLNITNATEKINLSSHRCIYEWSVSIGGTYIGWIKIAELNLNNSNHFGDQNIILRMSRTYHSPEPEGYTIEIDAAWNNQVSLTQLSGRASGRSVQRVRLAEDASAHKLYLEVYSNPKQTTYYNTLDVSMDVIGSPDDSHYGASAWTTLNVVQTEAESALTILGNVLYTGDGMVTNQTIKSTKNGSTSNAALYVENNVNGTDTMASFVRTDTGTHLGVGIGTGGTNHGLWSSKLNKWLVHSDGTDAFIAEQKIKTSAGSTSGYFYLGPILVQYGTQTFSDKFINLFWASNKRSATEGRTLNYPIAFSSTPTFTANIQGTAAAYGIVMTSTGTASASPAMTFLTPSGYTASSAVDITVSWIAIGKA